MRVPRDHRFQLAFDAAVALGALVVSASVFLSLQRSPGFDGAARGDAGVVAVLLAVHALCLAWRRVRPLTTLIVNLVSGLAVVALGWPPVALGIAVIIAVYSAGAGAPRRMSAVGLVAAEASVVLVRFLEAKPSDYSTLLGNAIGLAVAWFVGNTVRSRREYAISLERRNRELEAARDELAQRAVAEERVRIARELHDVIAHSMSVIAVQSGVGVHVMDEDPVAAKNALEVIEKTSRSALVELRGVLGILRNGEAAGSFDPAPSLTSLDRLIEQLKESSGLEIDHQSFGEAPDLPAGVQLTIFRITQEALTNVIKHARARRARVAVSYDRDTVRVEVVDDGGGTTRVNEGNGLRGMRERIEIYGGHLEFGSLPEGGFRVAASLPLGG